MPIVNGANRSDLNVGAASLGQFKSDATTPIDEGQTTTEDTVVVFGATLTSSSTDQLRFEVEVATSTANFMGTATATSSLVDSGIFATTSIQLLADGHYHWQARVVDTSTTVAFSWRAHSTTSTTDFVVHQVRGNLFQNLHLR